MSDPQREAHDDLAGASAALQQEGGAPLGPDDSLRLTTLLSTQRIAASGMAQLEFGEAWPNLIGVPDRSEPFLRGLGSPKLSELREAAARRLRGSAG